MFARQLAGGIQPTSTHSLGQSLEHTTDESSAEARARNRVALVRSLAATTYIGKSQRVTNKGESLFSYLAGLSLFLGISLAAYQPPTTVLMITRPGSSVAN